MPRLTRSCTYRSLGCLASFFLLGGFVLLGSRQGSAQTAPPLRRVNVPFLGGGVPFAPSIFWLGKVNMDTNYGDVRMWYYDTYIDVVVHMPDRVLWHDSSNSLSQITSWDAVSLYLDLAAAPASIPQTTSYWFVRQLQGPQIAYRGNGSGWGTSSVSFTGSDSWRGNGPNDTVWDMGWMAEFKIPFTSLGLTGPPAAGSQWRLGVIIHDRDDQAGTPIAEQIWPETLQKTNPSTWGQLHFGLPVYAPSTTAATGTTIVRNGLNGAVVKDAAVGGHTICGGNMNAWTEWGNANYAGYTQFNIQNQWDIADFMCFSKYYVTFPLSALPAGKGIVSAKVTLNLFGNAGYTVGDAKPSAIDVLTVGEDWNESTITWNNAPYAGENVSVTWVYPIDSTHTAGPYDWDVSYAVAEAYRSGQPLRLAFYSTDGDYHSGKYFYTSDSTDWSGTVRPTLEVKWGDATAVPSAPTNVRIVKE